MFNMFYELFPILAFFILFKWKGIYAATVAGIIITALQCFISYIIQKKIDKKQLITLIVFTVFGGMTLYFHNPIFVKWKPTVVFWIFAIILAVSHFIGKKTIMQRMAEGMMQENKMSIPAFVWNRLSWSWVAFFTLMGALNIYIAYTFSTDTWVNFKIFGILGLMIVFSCVQAFFLSRYLSEESK